MDKRFLDEEKRNYIYQNIYSVAVTYRKLLAIAFDAVPFLFQCIYTLMLACDPALASRKIVRQHIVRSLVTFLDCIQRCAVSNRV
uniref:Uncharacterized protein n=1 Tax=Daphnia magna TaxID=35525 RepID=A0A0P6HLC3_9CRUS